MNNLSSHCPSLRLTEHTLGLEHRHAHFRGLHVGELGVTALAMDDLHPCVCVVKGVRKCNGTCHG